MQENLERSGGVLDQGHTNRDFVPGTPKWRERKEKEQQHAHDFRHGRLIEGRLAGGVSWIYEHDIENLAELKELCRAREQFLEATEKFQVRRRLSDGLTFSGDAGIGDGVSGAGSDFAKLPVDKTLAQISGTTGQNTLTHNSVSAQNVNDDGNSPAEIEIRKPVGSVSVGSALGANPAKMQVAEILKATIRDQIAATANQKQERPILKKEKQKLMEKLRVLKQEAVKKARALEKEARSKAKQIQGNSQESLRLTENSEIQEDLRQTQEAISVLEIAIGKIDARLACSPNLDIDGAVELEDGGALEMVGGKHGGEEAEMQTSQTAQSQNGSAHGEVFAADGAASSRGQLLEKQAQLLLTGDSLPTSLVPQSLATHLARIEQGTHNKVYTKLRRKSEELDDVESWFPDHTKAGKRQTLEDLAILEEKLDELLHYDGSMLCNVVNSQGRELGVAMFNACEPTKMMVNSGVLRKAEEKHRKEAVMEVLMPEMKKLLGTGTGTKKAGKAKEKTLVKGKKARDLQGKNQSVRELDDGKRAGRKAEALLEQPNEEKRISAEKGASETAENEATGSTAGAEEKDAVVAVSSEKASEDAVQAEQAANQAEPVEGVDAPKSSVAPQEVAEHGEMSIVAEQEVAEHGERSINTKEENQAEKRKEADKNADNNADKGADQREVVLGDTAARLVLNHAGSENVVTTATIPSTAVTSAVQLFPLTTDASSSPESALPELRDGTATDANTLTTPSPARATTHTLTATKELMTKKEGATTHRLTETKELMTKKEVAVISPNSNSLRSKSPKSDSAVKKRNKSPNAVSEAQIQEIVHSTLDGGLAGIKETTRAVSAFQESLQVESCLSEVTAKLMTKEEKLSVKRLSEVSKSALDRAIVRTGTGKISEVHYNEDRVERIRKEVENIQNNALSAVQNACEKAEAFEITNPVRAHMISDNVVNGIGSAFCGRMRRALVHRQRCFDTPFYRVINGEVRGWGKI